LQKNKKIMIAFFALVILFIIVLLIKNERLVLGVESDKFTRLTSIGMDDVYVKFKNIYYKKNNIKDYIDKDNNFVERIIKKSIKNEYINSCKSKIYTMIDYDGNQYYIVKCKKCDEKSSGNNNIYFFRSLDDLDNICNRE